MTPNEHNKEVLNQTLKALESVFLFAQEKGVFLSKLPDKEMIKIKEQGDLVKLEINLYAEG